MGIYIRGGGGGIHYANTIFWTESIGTLHSQHCLSFCAQVRQHTVWPQGQKVAPMVLLLHIRQVMALLSRLSSVSSSFVLASTWSCGSKTPLWLLSSTPVIVKLLFREVKGLGGGEGTSLLGSISEYTGGGEGMRFSMLLELISEAPLFTYVSEPAPE